MPHVSHRIDMLIVPAAPEGLWTASGIATLRANWQDRQWLDGEEPGAAVADFLPGGFARLRLDEPGRMVLYANQQGGFQVRCPDTGDNIAAAFGAALGQWKQGAPRSMQCPACGAEHALEACVLRPEGAFARMGLVLADVGSISLTAEAQASLEETLGPVRIVLRRVS